MMETRLLSEVGFIIKEVAEVFSLSIFVMAQELFSVPLTRKELEQRLSTLLTGYP